MSWEQFTLLIVGMLIGVLGHVITSALTSERETRKIRDGIHLELREFAYRLVQIVQFFASKYGQYTREKIDWLDNHERSYRGSFPLKSSSLMLAGFQTMTDEQLEAFNLKKRQEGDDNAGTHVKLMALPYLESKLASISSFPESEQAHLLEIRSQLSIYNEAVEEARQYFWLTFDGGVIDNNHRIVVKSLRNTYDDIAHRAEFIVNRIDALEI